MKLMRHTAAAQPHIPLVVTSHNDVYGNITHLKLPRALYSTTLTLGTTTSGASTPRMEYYAVPKMYHGHGRPGSQGAHGARMAPP